MSSLWFRSAIWGGVSLEVRCLGVEGPDVGAIGLGCASFGPAYGSDWVVDADALVGYAVACGVTLIDTADSYGPYISEELLGKALRGRREDGRR